MIVVCLCLCVCLCDCLCMLVKWVPVCMCVCVYVCMCVCVYVCMCVCVYVCILVWSSGVMVIHAERLSLIDCLVIVCCLCGAITILTGELFELAFATKWSGAGHMNSLVFSIVIPASITSGNFRKSDSLMRTPLLTSALSLWVTSFAMAGLSFNVLNADSELNFAVYANSLFPCGGLKTLLMCTCPLGLLGGCGIPRVSML